MRCLHAPARAVSRAVPASAPAPCLFPTEHPTGTLWGPASRIWMGRRVPEEGPGATAAPGCAEV